LSSNVPTLEKGVPTSEEDYQRRAADLLRIAQETDNPTNKALLLEMAQAWLNLAKRVKAIKGSIPED
jgi:hypothetical protein